MICFRVAPPLVAGSALTLISLCSAAAAADAAAPNTATPIKHLVVVFQENVSFDHYFATYPKAANVDGEPAFKAADNTPTDINTLANAGLIDNNPDKTQHGQWRGCGGSFRLDRTRRTAAQSQNHGYTAEQAAYNNFAMDLFPANTGRRNKGGAPARSARRARSWRLPK